MSAGPHAPYSADIELDPTEFKPAFNFVERLAIDSDLAGTIPLVPAGQDPDPRFEDLPSDVRRIYENYPLVKGEYVLSIRMLCLDEDWEGMPRRTVFVERETNFSRAYFAVPALRTDARTPVSRRPCCCALRFAPRRRRLAWAASALCSGLGRRLRRTLF